MVTGGLWKVCCLLGLRGVRVLRAQELPSMSHGGEFAKGPGPVCPPTPICVFCRLQQACAQLCRFGNFVGRGSTVVMEFKILLQPQTDLKDCSYLK